ncbi:MAG TPA: penicillin-insensitive murein endopeptidase [Gemmatimonadales bacterium]|nr:penicillin-insensitive murein endopeptidase [Gemmatimonadales bacterium]
MTLARRRLWVIAGGVTALLLVIWWSGNDLIRLVQSNRPSVAHGTASDGWLENGKRLPTSGANFHAYSRLGALLGRASVHGRVRDVLLAAYAELATRRPDIEWIYGEMGWPSGGPFPPHRTHENGTSVDLMVPVLDRDGRPAALPTGPLVKFGYAIDFDASGRWKGLRVDFPAVAEHLLVVDSIARVRGIPVARVILTPDYQDELRQSELGRRALATIPWMVGRPWIRHDEHYHIDFAVPGRPAER